MEVLKATRREKLGTHVTRRLRKEGMTPCVIYGHGQENVHVTVSQHDLDLAIHHSQHLVEIEIDGVTEPVLIKDYQYDTFGQELLHADLTRVNLDERVEVTVPVVLRGTAEGTKEGGVMTQANAEVTISCVVTRIPEDIRPLVTEMQIGDTLAAGDLELPNGATLVSDPSLPICSITVVEEEMEEVEEFDPEAGPEVIGEKAEDDEGDEGAE
jgi:large subunit ribosomal protein L25